MPGQPDPIDGLVTEFDSVARRAIRSRGIEPVHEVRVAIRRLFQGLTLYHPAKKIRKPLRHLMKLSGDVRDCDIALSLLKGAWAKDSTPLRERVAKRRASSRGMLAAELKTWLETAGTWRSGIGAPKALDTAVLPKMAEDFLKRGERVATKRPDLARLHKFRIQTKRLRYSLEIMQPALGEGAGAWNEPLQAVQKVLGQINDCRIVLDMDRELGGGKAIDGPLQKRLKSKIRKFRVLWNERFSGVATKEWLQALEPPPRKPMARSHTAAPLAKAAKRA